MAAAIPAEEGLVSRQAAVERSAPAGHAALADACRAMEEAQRAVERLAPVRPLGGSGVGAGPLGPAGKSSPLPNPCPDSLPGSDYHELYSRQSRPRAQIRFRSSSVNLLMSGTIMGCPIFTTLGLSPISWRLVRSW